MPSPAPPPLHLTHPDAHVPRYELGEGLTPPLTRGRLVLYFVLAVIIAGVGFALTEDTHTAPDAVVPLGWAIPFGLLLLAIAGMPFVARHFWEKHYHYVALVLTALVGGYYLVGVENGPANLGRAIGEYISFVFVLGSLYVVSGGVLIRVRIAATPLANVALLACGAVLANVLGTTGASVLLIRPYLRMNRGHLRAFHVVFFIFIVSNAGGGLTPVGDPPLFLGFLRGVPFWWVAAHGWPIWLTVNGLLLALFLAFDGIAHRGTRRSASFDTDAGPAVSIHGAANLLLAGLIVVGILGQTPLNAWTQRALGFEAPWRELAMAVAAFASLATTPRRIHAENHFNGAPIREVAYLFAGLFVTMVPALNYLARHADALPLHTPGQYYFACGGLSGVLDNAPTYLTFLKTELATRAAAPGGPGVPGLLADAEGSRRLIAISMGAVLFGAMTYIGNGPNFMVRSIAEHSGVATPGFFRYVFAFSLPVLLPILVLVWLIFLR